MHSTLLVILVWMINQWCWGYLLDRGNVSFTFYLIFFLLLFLSGAAASFTAQKEEAATVEDPLLLRELYAVLGR